MPRITVDTAKPKHNALHALVDLGQSPWLDSTGRELIRSRELQRLIDEDAVRGLTTNPTIFERAIAADNTYDADIIALSEAGFSPEEVLERLMVAEVQEACDAFGRVYHESLGRDGYVSLEVAPQHARDAAATVAHARHLWELVGRRNLMLKIPGTREGLEAIEACLALGINVNVTLVFSVRRFAEVSETYLSAIGARRQMGLPLDWVSSVTSFFVGRVDDAVDRELGRIGTSEALSLKGRAAVANATLAWDAYTQMLAGPVWRSFATEGARVQRPLWASMGVKDASRSPLHYCESLVAPATASTLPPATLRAYRGEGRPAVRLGERAVEAARETAAALARQGVSLERVARHLEEEGVAKFTRSWASLLETVERKAAVLATRV